ncbi:MAG TPA: ATPase domain-containing protein [Polyangiaceae bacterium]|jgi:circadian clock protein KaiC
MTDDSTTKPLERVRSGVPGLDAILCGGFFRGGVYIFLATPGSGKTILGNQICFQHVASGGRALFVTLLAESHARMITQLGTLTFFDVAVVGQGLLYLAGYDALEKGKLKGLIHLLRQVVRDHNATLLVIDGVVTAGSMAESEIEAKKFVHELQVFSELAECTTLLLTGPSDRGEQYAMRTMVDGLIAMHVEGVEMDTVRSIEVTKSRGSPALMGRHLYEITNAGLTIYPRTETLYGKAMERPDPTHLPSSAFGVEALDAMLGGGVRAGSITMLLGSPGSGKTLLGLSFLAAGGRIGERGLYFGFFETPSDLCRKSDEVGSDLSAHVRGGLVDVLWQAPLGALADALVEKLLANIAARGVRRVVIDGLGGLKDSLVHAERARRFFSALCNELRTRDVSTVLTDETRSLVEIESPEHGLTAMLDNIIFMRHVELGAQLHKLVSVMKMREGVGDPSLREFSIGPRGIVVSPNSDSAHVILAGLDQGTFVRPAPRDESDGRR